MIFFASWLDNSFSPLVRDNDGYSRVADSAYGYTLNQIARFTNGFATIREVHVRSIPGNFALDSHTSPAAAPHALKRKASLFESS